MEDILKIVAAAVAAVARAVVVKQRVREAGLVLSLAVGALVLIIALGTVESMCAPMDELGETVGLSSAVLAPVFKTVDIAVLTHTPAEVCRDTKESGIMASVETVGAAVALCVALPLLRAISDTVMGSL